MTITATELAGLLTAWLWPFFRIAALVSAGPVFGNRSVPVRIRLGIALALTLVIAPLVPPMPRVDPLSGTGLIITVQQVLIGLTLGFALRVMFAVLELGGEIIAHLMGLGFASLVDPNNGVSVPVVSHFYIILATLVFLSIDGHLLVIQTLAESFVRLPVGGDGIGTRGLWNLAGLAGWVFSAALVMALPAIVALLTVNLAFGVMTRAAPQLNIFAVGFPVSLIFGFLVMILTLPVAVSQFAALAERSIEFAESVVYGG